MDDKLDALFHGQPPSRIEKVCLEPISEASINDYKVWLPILRAERYLRSQVETCPTSQDSPKAKRRKPNPFPLRFECFQHVRSTITAVRESTKEGTAHLTFEVDYEGGQRTVFFFRATQPYYSEEVCLLKELARMKCCITFTIAFTRVGAILWGRNKLKIAVLKG